MVRNAYDVPGLKILNSNSSEKSSSYSVFSGSAEKSTHKKGNKESSSDSSDNSK